MQAPVYFEDLEIGQVLGSQRKTMTESEIIDFAWKYDPQPFHLDDEAAAKTHFGRISASGWHTCAMTMSMLVANLTANKQAGLGSPGVDELRWKKPVYPGDTLRCETEVIEKRRSASRPEMGVYRSRVRVLNQDDLPVMTFISNGLIRTRDPEGTD